MDDHWLVALGIEHDNFEEPASGVGADDEHAVIAVVDETEGDLDGVADVVVVDAVLPTAVGDLHNVKDTLTVKETLTGSRSAQA